MDNSPCHPESLIVMHDIHKVFKTPAGEFPALRGITTCFYRGEFVSVVGKSGSGKSTLVNMITGIDRPTRGRVCIANTCIQDLSESQMSAWRGRNLGIVFQFFQLLPTMSVMENVLLPMDFANIIPAAQREPRAMELLELVGMAHLAEKLPGALAGGQQQSVAIARALANDPPILIADEPTGNLDSRTADAVFEVFASLVAQGKTILMVTHDSSLAARTERSLLIVDGQLVSDSRNGSEASRAADSQAHSTLEPSAGQPVPAKAAAPLRPPEPPAVLAAPGLGAAQSEGGPA